VVQAGHQVILSWSDTIRYAAKKMGYHGGGSPQEVIIPVGVYRNTGETGAIDGWREVPRQEPNWWQLEMAVAAPLEDTSKPAVKSVGKTKQDTISGDLFAQLETDIAHHPPVGSDGAQDWLPALFASPV